jgi:hypothetical protein
METVNLEHLLRIYLTISDDWEKQVKTD